MDTTKNNLPLPSFTTCLWFNGEGMDAAQFYTSIFSGSAISQKVKNTEGSALRKEGSDLTVAFTLSGQSFLALNGGPQFKFNPSISFLINCDSEDEVNYFWKNLSDGGSVLMPLDKYPFSEKYGWLSDKFGVSWQIILSKNFPEKIIPALMFTGNVNGRAQEAMKFYESLFPNGKIGTIKYYDNSQPPNLEGSVMFGDLKIADKWFAAMDSGYDHQFSFNEAISFIVNCGSQKEIDYYWDNLTRDGDESQCGWLKDKFGISWQIVPKILPELLADKNRLPRVMNAFMKMKKFDIEQLKNA